MLTVRAVALSLVRPSTGTVGVAVAGVALFSDTVAGRGAATAAVGVVVPTTVSTWGFLLGGSSPPSSPWK